MKTATKTSFKCNNIIITIITIIRSEQYKLNVNFVIIMSLHVQFFCTKIHSVTVVCSQEEQINCFVRLLLLSFNSLLQNSKKFGKQDKIHSIHKNCCRNKILNLIKSFHLANEHNNNSYKYSTIKYNN
jgi:hypothetical protein